MSACSTEPRPPAPQLAREEALSRLDAALAGAAASQAPLLVIADDTAHLTSMRHDLLQLARTRALLVPHAALLAS